MTAKGHHPQALVSCIYSLDDLFPLDFAVENSGNERASVEKHLLKLNCGDVVIYDRGYFSFQMVKMHPKHGIDFIFRLPKLYKISKAFLELEKFRAKTRRGICQEIYASFFIVS